MSYTFKQLCEIEQTINRTTSAVRRIGVTDDVGKALAGADHLLAEIRQAGMTLCDQNATALHKEDALMRLARLFEESRT